MDVVAMDLDTKDAIEEKTGKPVFPALFTVHVHPRLTASRFALTDFAPTDLLDLKECS
jgi:hypothetical protein